MSRRDPSVGWDLSRPGSSPNPGLAPGVRRTLACVSRWIPRDPVRVVFELGSHVALHTRKIIAVQRGHIVAPRPSNASHAAPIRRGRRATLGKSDEVAEPDVGSKAYQEMDVVGQHGPPQKVYTRLPACTRYRAFHVNRRETIHTGHSLPRVPGDVRVELVGSMLGHLRFT